MFWGVDGAALPANFSKKGFFDEQNINDRFSELHFSSKESCFQNSSLYNGHL